MKKIHLVRNLCGSLKFFHCDARQVRLIPKFLRNPQTLHTMLEFLATKKGRVWSRSWKQSGIHFRLGSSLRIFFENRKNHRKSLEFSKWHAKGDAK